MNCKTCANGIATAYCPDCGAAASSEGLAGLRVHILGVLRWKESGMANALRRWPDYKDSEPHHKTERAIAKWRSWLAAVDEAILTEKSNP